MPKDGLSSAVSRVDGLVFSASTVEAAKRAVEECLQATEIVRSPERNAQGSPVYIERPDFTLRLAAAVKVIEWEHGKPKQMMVVESPANNREQRLGPGDLMTLARKHPDIVAAIFSEADFELGKRRTIDVTPTSTETTPPPPESQSEASPSQKP